MARFSRIRINSKLHYKVNIEYYLKDPTTITTSATTSTTTGTTTTTTPSTTMTTATSTTTSTEGTLSSTPSTTPLPEGIRIHTVLVRSSHTNKKRDTA